MDPAAKKRTLDEFQYPDGAPFTTVEFKFTLLVLNAVPHELASLQKFMFSLSDAKITYLNDFFGTEFLDPFARELDFSKAHRILVDVANVMGWDSFGVQHVCNLLHQEFEVHRQHIYQTISSKHQNRFISHKLKALIQNYECTARHFWTKHARHFPEMKCAICFEMIESTKRLSGRGREVQYIGCCFSKVHPACFTSFRRATFLELKLCLGCETQWVNGYIDEDGTLEVCRTTRAALLTAAKKFPIGPSIL